MKRHLLILLTFVLLITGCTDSKATLKGDSDRQIEQDMNTGEKSDNKHEGNSMDNDIEIIDSEKNSNIVDENIEKSGKTKSPLTGLYVDENQILKRPIAVMIDNYYKARPQAGLSEADVIYEILAEGNITRYLAIFHSKVPETIGPVRSARPYFISKALEYDPLYVHVGGSPQALEDVRNLKMADIDALRAGRNVFWRKKHKPIPNNMYTDIEALKREAKRRKYREIGNFETLSFNEKETDISDGSTLIGIKFPYRSRYISEFRYNEDDKVYYRYINNEPHKDEITKIHLSAKNIIVQFVDTKVIDSEGRLEIDIVGNGKGLYITNGKCIDINWNKDDRRSLTRLYDKNGNEIKLNPGITWYQIVPSSTKIIIK